MAASICLATHHNGRWSDMNGLDHRAEFTVVEPPLIGGHTVGILLICEPHDVCICKFSLTVDIARVLSNDCSMAPWEELTDHCPKICLHLQCNIGLRLEDA